MARDNADLNPVSAMENPAGLEQRVADWYQNSTIGFHTLNAEGIIVSINDTELNWVGYRRDEVVGKGSPRRISSSRVRSVFALAARVGSDSGSLAPDFQ